MTKRTLFISALTVLCLGGLAGIIAQRHAIANLNAEEARLAQTAAPGHTPAPITSARPPSPELLQLRSQVSQLTERKRELMASQNAIGAVAAQPGVVADLPPGFIRKSEAQWAGTSRPEDTFQSAVWALHHRQLESLFQLIDPTSVDGLKQQIGNSPQKFFDDAATIPAMGLLNPRFFGAATIKAQLQLGVNDSQVRTIFFFNRDGQWKMVLDLPNTRFTP